MLLVDDIDEALVDVVLAALFTRAILLGSVFHIVNISAREIENAVVIEELLIEKMIKRRNNILMIKSILCFQIIFTGTCVYCVCGAFTILNENTNFSCKIAFNTLFDNQG